MKRLSVLWVFLGFLGLNVGNTTGENNNVWNPNENVFIGNQSDTSFLAFAQNKNSFNRKSRKTSQPSTVPSNTSSNSTSNPTVSPTEQPSKANWITAQNTNCQVLVDSSMLNPAYTWTGQSTDGKASGYGLLVVYSNGKEAARYEGEMKEGKPEGYGIYTEPGGNIYEGELKNGRMEGRGLYRFNKPIPNSASRLFQVKGSITGEFKNNLPFLGKYVQDTVAGTIYGEFSQWQLQGKAVVYGVDFTVLSEFQNSNANGRGVYLIKKNGVEHRYEGEIINNVPKSFPLTMQKLFGAKQINIKDAKAHQVGIEAQQIADLAKQKSEEAQQYIRQSKDRIKREIEEKRRLEEERKRQEEQERRRAVLAQREAEQREQEEKARALEIENRLANAKNKKIEEKELDGMDVLIGGAILLGGVIVAGFAINEFGDDISEGFDRFGNYFNELVDRAEEYNRATRQPFSFQYVPPKSYPTTKNSWGNYQNKVGPLRSTPLLKYGDQVVRINGKNIIRSKPTQYSNRTEWTITSESGYYQTLSYYPNTYSEKKYSLGITNYYSMDEALRNFANAHQ